jgi:hypothetical protein
MTVRKMSVLKKKKSLKKMTVTKIQCLLRKKFKQIAI